MSNKLEVFDPEVSLEEQLKEKYLEIEEIKAEIAARDASVDAAITRPDAM